MVFEIIGIDIDMYNKPHTTTPINDDKRSSFGICDKFGLYQIAIVAKIIFHKPETIQNVGHEENDIDDSVIIRLEEGNGEYHHTPNHSILIASTFHFAGRRDDSTLVSSIC